MQMLAGYAKAQQPLLQAGSINPSWTGSVSRLPGDLHNSILSDVERYKLQDNVVVLDHFNIGDNKHRVLFLKHVDDRLS